MNKPETDTCNSTSNPVPMQDGVMQAAITDFIRNDESIMQAIIDTVGNALVTKLLRNMSFIAKTDKLNMELQDSTWQEVNSDENPCTCTLNDTFIAIITSLIDK